MQERAQSIDAEILIDSQIDYGTSITIRCKKD
jgi:signal transduction histidine kinase